MASYLDSEGWQSQIPFVQSILRVPLWQYRNDTNHEETESWAGDGSSGMVYFWQMSKEASSQSHVYAVRQRCIWTEAARTGHGGHVYSLTLQKVLKSLSLVQIQSSTIMLLWLLSVRSVRFHFSTRKFNFTAFVVGVVGVKLAFSWRKTKQQQHGLEKAAIVFRTNKTIFGWFG